MVCGNAMSDCMSINRDVSRQMSYDDITDTFAAIKSRRVHF